MITARACSTRPLLNYKLMFRKNCRLSLLRPSADITSPTRPCQNWLASKPSNNDVTTVTSNSPENALNLQGTGTGFRWTLSRVTCQPQPYQEVKGRTNKLYNSPIFNMRRRLNVKPRDHWPSILFCKPDLVPTVFWRFWQLLMPAMHGRAKLLA